ncbi:MAG: AAA family ATPase [Phycisphaerae bacterium]
MAPATGEGFKGSAPSRREARSAEGGRGGVHVEAPGHRPTWSARVVEAALRFGVEVAAPLRRIAEGLELPIRPGGLVLITGPSGTGKSLLLEALAKRYPSARLVQGGLFPTDVAVIDAVSPGRAVEEAMGFLTACGLGEPRLWVRPLGALSAGEQSRARLARALSQHLARRGEADGCGAQPAPLLCDEFGSGLHTRVAQAIAFNLRKLASRERLALVVATCRDDLEADLRPDLVVRLTGSAEGVRVEQRRPAEDSGASGERDSSAGRGPSFAAKLGVERGSLRDYATLGAMHYRQGEQLGFVDQVFALRDPEGETLGVAVYGRPGLELRARNAATAGRFRRNPERLNRELRVLKRLIVHPDVRGCGLGARLVRESLPRVGVRFVECLAAMGLVNPVFEKAGMMRIGTCALPRRQEAVLRELLAMGADPLSADFETRVGERPEARALVEQSVRDWYRSMTGGGRERVERQSARTLARTFRQLVGSRPVYYLWAQDAEGWAVIERAMAGEDGRREGGKAGKRESE